MTGMKTLTDVKRPFRKSPGVYLARGAEVQHGGRAWAELEVWDASLRLLRTRFEVTRRMSGFADPLVLLLCSLCCSCAMYPDEVGLSATGDGGTSSESLAACFAARKLFACKHGSHLLLSPIHKSHATAHVACLTHTKDCTFSRRKSASYS